MYSSVVLALFGILFCLSVINQLFWLLARGEAKAIPVFRRLAYGLLAVSAIVAVFALVATGGVGIGATKSGTSPDAAFAMSLDGVEPDVIGV